MTSACSERSPPIATVLAQTTNLLRNQAIFGAPRCLPTIEPGLEFGVGAGGGSHRPSNSGVNQALAPRADSKSAPALKPGWTGVGTQIQHAGWAVKHRTCWMKYRSISADRRPKPLTAVFTD